MAGHDTIQLLGCFALKRVSISNILNDGDIHRISGRGRANQRRLQPVLLTELQPRDAPQTRP